VCHLKNIQNNEFVEKKYSFLLLKKLFMLKIPSQINQPKIGLRLIVFVINCVTQNRF